jgi:phospholipase C
MAWNDIPEHLQGAARAAAIDRREFLRRSAMTAGIGLTAAAALSPGQVLAQLSRTESTAVPLGDAMGIDHFVILMMENRSFDHYFGWLDPTIADASQHQSYADPSGTIHETRHVPDIVGADAQWQGCGFGDPGHGWGAGRAQLQRGFMAEGSGNDDFALGYYNQGELGFIHAAAEKFNLYDKYFCSLLGPTWPNRYYKWSAQSGGLKDNTPPVATLGNQWDTIFDKAARERPNDVTVRYYNSDLPFSAVWGARGAAWTRPVAEYYADCAAGTLANITIVDPPFRDGGGFDGNSADEHPLGDVRLGQAFMADVAHAFLSSPHFERGALFIIYDEWGGFFDHVTPPKAADDRASANLDEDFGQMGFRTPSVVLSPYTLGGGVSHLGPLGHESILKLIRQRFALSPLCTRDANAISIGESFDWTVDPSRVEVPDLPHPSHIVSKPCSLGGGDIVADDGSHAGDMDGLEELAHRFGIRVGAGRPHDLFREPTKVQAALAGSAT